jgi:hypothetical protein
LRHEHLAGFGLGGDAGRDVDRDAANAIPVHFHLSRVHPGPDAETERPQRAEDRRRAADRARRAVEGGECAVA